jgi:hypothetical protein
MKKGTLKADLRRAYGNKAFTNSNLIKRAYAKRLLVEAKRKGNVKLERKLIFYLNTVK